MPRFSANLGFLWTDRPLPEAIEAAAQAGQFYLEILARAAQRPPRTHPAEPHSED